VIPHPTLLAPWAICNGFIVHAMNLEYFLVRFRVAKAGGCGSIEWSKSPLALLFRGAHWMAIFALALIGSDAVLGLVIMAVVSISIMLRQWYILWRAW
jgi:hypothetical protein